MGTLGTCIPSVGFPISKLPILEYLIINKILKSIIPMTFSKGEACIRKALLNKLCVKSFNSL